MQWRRTHVCAQETDAGKKEAGVSEASKEAHIRIRQRRQPARLT